MKYLIGTFCLSVFVTASIVAAFFLNRRKDDQLGEDAAKWLNDNAQRQRDGRCEFQTPTKTEGTALRSSVREPHAVANASSEREVLGIDQSVNGTTSNSFNAKEVVNNTTPKRAESGARDLHPCRVYPTGRWSTRN